MMIHGTLLDAGLDKTHTQRYPFLWFNYLNLLHFFHINLDASDPLVLLLPLRSLLYLCGCSLLLRTVP